MADDDLITRAERNHRVERMTTKPNAPPNQIIAEIVATLKAKLTDLEKPPGRCETCPACPCEYCEFRGCLSLLKRLDERVALGHKSQRLEIAMKSTRLRLLMPHRRP